MDYRFGFNGQEKVNEIAGIGNHLDFKFIGYDSRIGRFWSVDPLTEQYPWLTPYQFAANTPIQAIDMEGAEARVVSISAGTDGKRHKSVIETSNSSMVQWQTIKQAIFSGFSASERTSGYEWTRGYREYTLGMGTTGKNKNGYAGPGQGTLTIDATGKTIMLSYDPTTTKRAAPKAPSFSESMNLAMRGAKVFFWKPDPLVEGSESFKKTFDNYLSGWSLAFGVGEISAFKGAFTVNKGWTTLGALSDLDDLTGASTTGLGLLENSASRRMLSTGVGLTKGVIGLKNMESGGTDMLIQGASGTRAVGTLLSGKTMVDGVKGAADNK